MTKRGMVLGKAQLGTQSKTSHNTAQERVCYECGGEEHIQNNKQLYHCKECDRYYDGVHSYH